MARLAFSTGPRTFSITGSPQGGGGRTIFETQDWADPSFQAIPGLTLAPGATVSFTTEFTGEQEGHADQAGYEEHSH